MHAALCVKENNDKNFCGTIRFLCCVLVVRQWIVYIDLHIKLKRKAPLYDWLGL